MLSAPSKPDSVSQVATLFRVLMGDDNGERPTVEDEIDYLIPLSVQLSAGAGRCDSIKVRFDWQKAFDAGVIDSPILKDEDLAFLGNDRILEIRATDANGEFTRVVGWGKLAARSDGINSEEQSGDLAARLDPYLFGRPLEGFPVFSSATRTEPIYAVTAGDAGDASFQVAGDLRETLRAGISLTVTDSTGNDGAYGVVSTDFDGVHTTIEVAEEVIDDTADGNLNWPPLTIDDKIVFNPLIDGRVQGNQSSKTVTTQGGYYNLFLDPESMLTPEARNQHPDEEISTWSMADAVNFLCQWQNPSESLINNPDPADLEVVFEDFDGSELRNFAIPLGHYLPDALDALLHPFGFNWFLKNSTDDDDPDGASQSTITIFRRGKGQVVQVYANRDDEPITLQGTNIGSFECESSLAQMANVVDGCSAIGHFQATFPLYPAWDPALNDTPLKTLSKDKLTPATHDIGRKWACGEAGDYTPTDGSNFGLSGITIQPLDLTSVFGESAVQMKRRVLKPCFSLDGPVGEGHSLEIWLEWWNPYAVVKGPSGTTVGRWEKLDQPHAVLHREMGVWFEGDFPPYLLWQYATKGPAAAVAPKTYNQPHWPFGLRVTASVQSDIRTWSLGERSDTSPNGADVTLVLDLSQKFPWRALALTGDYASQLPGTASIEGVTSGKAGKCEFQTLTDLTATFPVGMKFLVAGSTGNDGPYTVTASSYSSGPNTTTISVAEAVPSAELDGKLVWNTDIIDPMHPTSGVAIDEYCRTIQTWQDAAQLSMSLVLDSASHTEYEIGHVIDKIWGRNIALNAKVKSSPSDDPRHPQIIGINYLLGDQQRMELVTESFRREQFPELEDKGEGRHSTGQTTVKHTTAPTKI